MADQDADGLGVACPFCASSELLMMDDDGKHYVLCLDCRACGPCVDSAEEALLVWCERQDEESASYMKAARLIEPA